LFLPNSGLLFASYVSFFKGKKNGELVVEIWFGGGLEAFYF